MRFVNAATGEEIAVHAFPPGEDWLAPGRVLSVTDKAGQVATWQVESRDVQTGELRMIPHETPCTDS